MECTGWYQCLKVCRFIMCLRCLPSEREETNLACMIVEERRIMKWTDILARITRRLHMDTNVGDIYVFMWIFGVSYRRKRIVYGVVRCLSCRQEIVLDRYVISLNISETDDYWQDSLFSYMPAARINYGKAGPGNVSRLSVVSMSSWLWLLTVWWLR